MTEHRTLTVKTECNRCHATYNGTPIQARYSHYYVYKTGEYDEKRRSSTDFVSEGHWCPTCLESFKKWEIVSDDRPT